MRNPARLSFLAVFLMACAASGIGFCSRATAQAAMPHPPALHHLSGYFSLEHRGVEQMNAADRDLLQARSRDIAAAGQIFGYDLSAGSWVVDQAVCPVFPGVMMVHYLEKFPDGSESLFTALVPRGRGRVRVVASLHRNAQNYVPAAKDPRNLALFNELVPAAIAKQDTTPEGNWLMLGVCYAEMVGARTNVPVDPGLDLAMLHAAVATFRLDTVTRRREIQFPDREGANVYTIWTIALDKQGRVRSARDEDYATYMARIVKLQEPQGRISAAPAEPQGRIVTPTMEPRTTVTHPPDIPQR